MTELQITDIYPDRAVYDSTTFWNENELKNREKRRLENLRNLESGHLYSAVSLALDFLFEKARREEAIYYCEMLLAAPATSNQHCVARYVLAGLCIPDEEYDKAIAILEKGRETDPWDGFLIQGLMHIYMHIGEHEKAIELLLEDYKIWQQGNYGNPPNEHNVECCDNIGICYYMDFQLEEARTWFKNAMLDPNVGEDWHAIMHYKIGECWRAENDEYRAMDAYKKALDIEPNYPEVYASIGLMARDLHGDLQEAIRNLEIAAGMLTDLYDPAAEIWVELFRLYFRVMEYKKKDHAYLMYQSCIEGVLLTAPPEVDDDDEDDELLESM